MKQFLGFILLSVAILLSPAIKAHAQDENSKAQVHMTEYYDYECPACGYYYPIVEKLKATFGDDLTIEYHFFPLNSHQFSALAARAAQAAKNQGKFKAMHDMLFKNQDYWANSGNPQSIFIGYAKEIGLDMNQFQDDLNAAKTQKTVMTEKQQGINMGINSTPTFFINGEMLQKLPNNFQEFKTIIESHMQKNG